MSRHEWARGEDGADDDDEAMDDDDESMGGSGATENEWRCAFLEVRMEDWLAAVVVFNVTLET